MGCGTVLPLVWLQGNNEACLSWNAIVDDIAVGPEGERTAIEMKSPRDDIIRGIGQCYETISSGYTRAVLVTTLKVARKLRKRAFQRRRIRLIGVDAKARVHGYDADGWRLLASKPQNGQEATI